MYSKAALYCYVAAELAKRSADSVLGAAYMRIESYVSGKLGRASRLEHIDEVTMRQSGLAADPVVTKFGDEVLARSPVLRRARLVGTVVQGARVLWVDDEPDNNGSECRMLTALGADVRQVRSTTEALAALGRRQWDLLLSDMDRDGDADAGLQMLRQLPRGSPPVVLYIGQVDLSRPVPLGAFGIADQPGPLLHLVLDVLERRRV